MTKTRGYLFLIIGLLLMFLPIIFYGWFESIDPAFIPNAYYNFLKSRILIALTILAVIIFFVRYKTNKKVRESLKYQFSEEGKLITCFTFLFTPILIYFYFWALSAVPIQLWAHYHFGEPWSQEYLLIKTDTCSSDYEPQCVKLTFSDLVTHEEHSIRWYLNKNELLTLKNKSVNLVGEKSYFGYIINEIQW